MNKSSGMAVDPGVRGCGWAQFEDGILVGAGYAPSYPGANMPSEVSFPQLMRLVKKTGVVVIEKPQIYQAARQKGSQEDIANLLICTGMVMGSLYHHTSEFRFVKPSAWGGQIPKDIKNKRVVERLTKDELGTIEVPSAGLVHNVYDAIGIGLNEFDPSRSLMNTRGLK